MAYTTIDDPSEYFQTLLYTGNGSARSLTNDGNSNLQPDWVWIKERNNAISHRVFDSTRGAGKRLFTNNDSGQSTHTPSVTSFDSDGFSVGDGTSVNENNDTYVAWQWKAGGGTTSTNNDGSVAVTLQTNTTAGFSIGTYTGTGSQLTIGHGLGVAPKVHITKKLNSADAWNVYHESIGNTHGLRLNNADAKEDFGFYGDTSPTSSVFTVGGVTNNDRLNTNGGSYVFYSFAEIKGYSKFGSYTGNGNADGTFVYTGFKPAWIMIKSTTASTSWTILDNKRDPFNVTTKRLFADESTAESDSTAGNTDFVSNGFKIRTSHSGINPSGGVFVYLAFAEKPFVSSEGVPVTAR